MFKVTFSLWNVNQLACSALDWTNQILTECFISTTGNFQYMWRLSQYTHAPLTWLLSRYWYLLPYLSFPAVMLFYILWSVSLGSEKRCAILPTFNLSISKLTFMYIVIKELGCCIVVVLFFWCVACRLAYSLKFQPLNCLICVDQILARQQLNGWCWIVIIWFQLPQLTQYCLPRSLYIYLHISVILLHC